MLLNSVAIFAGLLGSMMVNTRVACIICFTEEYNVSHLQCSSSYLCGFVKNCVEVLLLSRGLY